MVKYYRNKICQFLFFLILAVFSLFVYARNNYFLESFTLKNAPVTSRFVVIIGTGLFSNFQNFPVVPYHGFAKETESQQNLLLKDVDFEFIKEKKYDLELFPFADDIGIHYITFLIFQLSDENLFKVFSAVQIFLYTAAVLILGLASFAKRMYLFPVMSALVILIGFFEFNATVIVNQFTQSSFHFILEKIASNLNITNTNIFFMEPYEYINFVPFILLALYFFSTIVGSGRKKILYNIGSIVSLFLLIVFLLIRSSGLVFIAFLLFFIFVSFLFSKEKIRSFVFRNLKFFSLILILIFSLKSMPNLLLSEAYKKVATTHHVFWHTIWCSLGEFAMDYPLIPFRVSDFSASVRANTLGKEKDPFRKDVQMYTDEYETILKMDVWEFVKKDTVTFLKILIRKCMIEGDIIFPSILISLSSIIFLRFLKKNPMSDLFASLESYSLLALLFLSGKVIVVLSFYFPPYNYPVFVGMVFFYEPILFLYNLTKRLLLFG